MKDLKPGDRVRVYQSVPFNGTVDSIDDVKVSVCEDGFEAPHDDSPFHIKQCRKLKKKEKLENPLKLNIHYDGAGSFNIHIPSNIDEILGCEPFNMVFLEVERIPVKGEKI